MNLIIYFNFLELLSLFVEQDNIKHQYKNKLVGYVLNGYLCLRKLVVQRTKLIDETQDKLLELLEELTTGKMIFYTWILKKKQNQQKSLKRRLTPNLIL